MDIDEESVGRFPATFPQELLILLDTLLPGGGFLPELQNAWAFEVKGPLELERLRASLETLVHRHDGLRISVAEGKGGSDQLLWAPRPFELSVEDLKSVPSSEVLATLQAAISAETTFRFAESSKVGLRARVFRLGDDEHVVVLIAHHLVTDAWSVSLIGTQLWEIYAGKELEPVALQCTRYAVDQRGAYTNAVHEERVAYWSKVIAGRPFSTVGSADGFVARFEFQPTEVTALGRVALRQRTAPFVLQLCLLAAFVAHENDDSSVLIPMVTAERDTPESRGMVGMVMDVLPVVLDIDLDGTFEELLRQARAFLREAWPNRMPVLKLMEGLPHLVESSVMTGRGNSSDARLAVFFNYIPSTGAGFDGPGLKVEGLEVSPYHWRTGEVVRPFEQDFLSTSVTVHDAGSAMACEVLGSERLAKMLPAGVTTACRNVSVGLRELLNV